MSTSAEPYGGPAPSTIVRQDCRLRVTLLLNMVAPSRLPVYEALARWFRLTVLYGGGEDDRSMWLAPEIQGAKVRKSRGLVLKRKRRVRAGGVWENNYLHLTPGYLPDLWRTDPDAVITNEMGFRTVAALLYATIYRRPVWIWWGGTAHTERAIGRVRRLIRSIIVRWARRWISYGDSSTEYLESLGVPRTRIVQVQNSVDERAFEARGDQAFDLGTRPVVLHVGRLVQLKGIHCLLEACAAVQREGIRFSLVILGEGPEREALEYRVGELGLNDVHFLGAKRPDQMAGIYRSADVLVFPTLRDVWGVVVNEALRSGLPVLASRYAGCAAELLPAENVFDPLDPCEFVTKLRMAVTKGLAPPDISRLWSSETVATTIAEEIDRTLASRRKAPACV